MRRIGLCLTHHDVCSFVLISAFEPADASRTALP
jgi:hypothetical protein